MLFSTLMKVTGGKLEMKFEDCDIKKFSFDSRNVTGLTSEMFVAIQGTNHDGHNFIEDAFGMGVRNFIVEKPTRTDIEANFLQVRSSVTALQQIACNHRRQFTYPVVGITGSNGKTTVKEWLTLLLSAELKVVKSPKSYNSQIGVPLSVLEMGKHDVGVFEAGISQKEEMKRLADIIEPTIGIFTNIGEAHSGGFSTRVEKIDEKIQLFRFADKVICCADQESTCAHLVGEIGNKLVRWSRHGNEAEYSYSINKETLSLEGSDLQFDLPFSNHQQIENLLHSITAAVVLGVSNESIVQQVAKIRPIPMRLELKKGVDNCYLVDDSYTNDLLGLEVAMDFMNEQSPHQSKTVVLSDILNSSLDDSELYERVESLVKTKNVGRVITIGHRIGKYLDYRNFLSTEEFLVELPKFKNETILVKGARDFGFERIVTKLEDKTHGTIMEVNFEALRANLNTYRSLLQPTTKTMVMVKAFAYGAGLTEIASFLQHQRVDYLGVAYVDEAVELRRNGITVPILIMNPQEIDFLHFDDFDLRAEIYSLDILERFIQSGSQVPIHIKLETGMNRLGFSEFELDELLKILGENKELKIEGIFTHFSSSDDSHQDEFTIEQDRRFESMSNSIVEILGYKPIRHAVNSSGMTRFPQYHYDMVRLGIGLYGFDPTNMHSLEVVCTLKTNISQIKQLTKGDSIGYSRKGIASHDTKIAILPIGYADGYLRVFGNGNGQVSINGHLAPTVGNVCMDMTMVDVTDLNVSEGDEVIVFGEQPNIQQMADWANTIPYEILTNISQRVKRVYVSE